MDRLTFVDIFAGIGGLTQGFLKEGRFECVGMFDVDHVARETCVKNFPEIPYFKRDVERLGGPDLLRMIQKPRIDGLIGCPPCQGLSNAGQRQPADYRNFLALEYLRLVKSLRPRFFVLENVPHLLRWAGFPEVLKKRTTALGYRTWQGVLNSAMYGVPQVRRRVVVIGVDTSLEVEPSPPPPTHGTGRTFDYASGCLMSAQKMLLKSDSLQFEGVSRSKLKPVVSLSSALSDLPTPSDGEQTLGYGNPPRNSYQRAMRNGSKGVLQHVPWSHGPGMRRRLRGIPEGGTWLARDKSGRSRKYYSNAYGRLHHRGLARTITGHFHNPGSGRFIHFTEHRTLTVREAARIQGIGDSFEFHGGSPSDYERLVGNAFPTPLAHALARHLDRQIG